MPSPLVNNPKGRGVDGKVVSILHVTVLTSLDVMCTVEGVGPGYREEGYMMRENHVDVHLVLTLAAIAVLVQDRCAEQDRIS